jgi:hypothetical protein
MRTAAYLRAAPAYLQGAMTAASVPEFLPSSRGLRFSNHFPAGVAVTTVPLPGLGRSIPVGDASNGVCGGMVYTVLDLFLASPRLPVPADTSPPPAGSALTEYVTARLVDSFALSRGLSSNVARYLSLMSTPDRDAWFVDGVGSVIARREWPKVKADIDAGRPSPLGLVGGVKVWPTDVAAKARMLGHCHQVLAYAYALDDAARLTLRVYDPNDPRADDSTIEASLADPGDGCPVATPRITAHIAGHGTFRAFFRHDYYTPKTPLLAA